MSVLGRVRAGVARLRSALFDRGPCGRRFCRNGCGRGGCDRLREVELP